MSRGSAIALRYARALYGLGDEPAALLAELDTLTEQILESDELRGVLFTPIHPRSERRAVMDELASKLDLSRELHAFSGLLVEENRTQLLAPIRAAMQELVDRAAGRLDATVTSARPLDAQEQEQLRDALSRRFDAQITLDLQVDESLIGGIVARVGDRLLDSSIRTQLATLGASLRKGSVT